MKFNYIILTIFLLSIISVSAQINPSAIAAHQNAVQDMQKAQLDSMQNLQKDQLKVMRNVLDDNPRFNKFNSEQAEKFNKLSEENYDRIVGLQEEQLDKMANLHEDMFNRVASLQQTQIEKLTSLNKDQMRKMAMIQQDQLDKISLLQKDQLNKLSSFDRERFKQFSEMNQEQINAELNKYKLVKINKESAFKKRVLTSEKIIERKNSYQLKAKQYDDFKLRYLDEKKAFNLAVQEGDEEAAIEHAKARLLYAADMIIASLEKVQLQLDASEDLSEEEVSDALADIAEKISVIEEAKIAIEAATTKEEVKTAASTIDSSWKRIQTKLQLHAENVVRSQVGEIFSRTDHLQQRFEMVLSLLEDQSVDIENIDLMVGSFSESVDSARVLFKEGDELFKQAKEQGDKDILVQSKEKTRAAHEMLKEAHSTLMEIVKLVGLSGLEFDIDEVSEEIFQVVELEY